MRQEVACILVFDHSVHVLSLVLQRLQVAAQKPEVLLVVAQQRVGFVRDVVQVPLDARIVRFQNLLDGLEVLRLARSPETVDLVN